MFLNTYHIQVIVSWLPCEVRIDARYDSTIVCTTVQEFWIEGGLCMWVCQCEEKMYIFKDTFSNWLRGGGFQSEGDLPLSPSAV